MMVVLLFFLTSNTIDALLKIEMDISLLSGTHKSFLYSLNIHSSGLNIFAFLLENIASTSSYVTHIAKPIVHISFACHNEFIGIQ